MAEHLAQSNREITLAVMVEDLPALSEIDAIAATDGIDIVAVGPSDMSRALGVAGTSDHPKLVEVIQRVAQAVQKGGVARLALPMNHPTLPRNAAQLRELGVGYTNCAPAPEVRMLRSMQAQVAEARAARLRRWSGAVPEPDRLGDAPELRAHLGVGFTVAAAMRPVAPASSRR
jgi:2-keto-3-deoxy-L-rhamnonate aldolase RhmA